MFDQRCAPLNTNEHGNTTGRAFSLLHSVQPFGVGQQIPIQMFGIGINDHHRCSDGFAGESHTSNPTATRFKRRHFALGTNLYPSSLGHSHDRVTQCAQATSHIPRTKICLNSSDARQGCWGARWVRAAVGGIPPQPLLQSWVIKHLFATSVQGA